MEPWRILGLDIERSVKFGDLLTAVSILIAVFVGIISQRNFRRTLKDGAIAQESAYYSELDRFYSEILKAALDTPHLRTPAKIADDADARLRDYLPFADGDPDKLAQYDTYAYMVWNFIETVHDRCVEDPKLQETWKPVIRAEDALHRGWFLAQIRDDEMRRPADGKEYRGPHKFCEGFRTFVEKRHWETQDWTYDGE
jgi:hypothetical protein